MLNDHIVRGFARDDPALLGKRVPEHFFEAMPIFHLFRFMSAGCCSRRRYFPKRESQSLDSPLL